MRIGWTQVYDRDNHDNHLVLLLSIYQIHQEHFIQFPTDTKEIALKKLAKIEAFDGFIGELSAEDVSKQYEDLEGISNSTYMANVVAGDKWWTKKYFSYMKDKPMNMANISDITFDTTEVCGYHLLNT